MKYGFIRDQAEHYPVKLLCEMLNVRRSAWYDWQGQPAKVIAPEELALRRRVRDLFAASRSSLGSRTMMNNLQRQGFEIGREKTRRLMKQLNLKVKHKRKTASTGCRWRRMYWTATFRRRHRIRLGEPISRSYGRNRAGFTWPW